MFGAVARRLFGCPSERAAKSLRRPVAEINALEPQMAALTDDGLASMTAVLREGLRGGASIDDLLPTAFAVAREASRRVLGQRHYDVQLMGGIVLHQGKVAEMKTGEGKTLVAVLPAYLNALTGEGVHVVTVNDYLARRDAEEMGRVFAFLGLSTGIIVPGMDDAERRLAYAADITYAVNTEIGFDYLRDNMKMTRADMVHRPFHYALVDEVDSILIDEARTPLIISGPGPDCAGPVQLANTVINCLVEGDWELDRASRSVSFTDAGLHRVEAVLEQCRVIVPGGHLHEGRHSWMVPFVHQALRARVLYDLDRHYIVRDGELMIVDENTGRVMDGRRYSDGLHQALEAKEGVAILPENHTLASVTYQNFFHLYPRLAGMTGTAVSDADELAEVYGLDVVPIPTNRPVAREDHEDEIYRTSPERDQKVVALVQEAVGRGQPVLVGTSSIERSESLSAQLKGAGITHAVLNARQHASEAHIIAQAGRLGAVTIATNMAGRGTDIKLGGNLDFLLAEAIDKEGAEVADVADVAALRAEMSRRIEADAERVCAAGGLLVIGTERHESRRVDDQLRGRAGRQGDPGASRFLVSLEDDLMRRFGGERMSSVLGGLGLALNEAIIHPWVSRAVRKAQQRVEAHNFETRLNLIRYDGIINGQRLAFYRRRLATLDNPKISEMFASMRADAVGQIAAAAMPANAWAEQWDVAGMTSDCERLFGVAPPVAAWAAEEGVGPAEITTRLRETVEERHAAHIGALPPNHAEALERNVLLQCLDRGWQEHLYALECLREGIGLRAYGQRNPLYEWHVEAASLYDRLFDHAGETAMALLSHLAFAVEQPVAPPEMEEPEPEREAVVA